MSRNVLTQTARLGLRSGWLGKIGDDEAGEILIKEFEREGVDTSHTEVVESKHSMFTWIQVDKHGGRSITMFPNVLIELTADEIEKTRRLHNIFQSISGRILYPAILTDDPGDGNSQGERGEGSV